MSDICSAYVRYAFKYVGCKSRYIRSDEAKTGHMGKWINNLLLTYIWRIKDNATDGVTYWTCFASVLSALCECFVHRTYTLGMRSTWGFFLWKLDTFQRIPWFHTFMPCIRVWVTLAHQTHIHLHTQDTHTPTHTCVHTHTYLYTRYMHACMHSYTHTHTFREFESLPSQNSVLRKIDICDYIA